MELILPWPPKQLFPNVSRRLHWSKVRKFAKEYRNICGLLARAETSNPSSLEFNVLFVPPDRRRRDLDNCIAALKAAQDGLQDGWGVDDSKFKMHYNPEFSEPVRGGYILITYHTPPLQ